MRKALSGFITPAWLSSRFIAELASKQVRVASADTFSSSNDRQNALRLSVGGPLMREDFGAALAIVRQTLEQENHEHVL